MIAEVLFSCGRHYLSVCGFAVAMEGDMCRGSDIPEGVLSPIPQEELSRASIGGKPAADMSLSVVRFFRGERWTPEMLRCMAEEINRRASEKQFG